MSYQASLTPIRRKLRSVRIIVDILTSVGYSVARLPERLGGEAAIKVTPDQSVVKLPAVSYYRYF